jgi:hypothetical protein
MPPLDPATIDENADVVTISQNGLDESLDLVSMSEVRCVDRSIPPERANLISCGGVAVVALYEHYVGSGFRQRYCHGLSDTPRCACDQRSSAV